jgi:hypothetical protein
VRHFQEAGPVTSEPEKSESTLGKFFRNLPGNKASEYAASSEGVAASRSMAELTREREGLLGNLAPWTAMTPSERTQRESRLAEVDQKLATIRKGRQDYVQGISPVTPTPVPQTSGADFAAPTDRDPATGRRIINGRVEDAPAGAPAPSTSPLAPRPSSYAAPSGAPAVDSADSDHTKLMKTLQGRADEGEALLRKSIRTPETLKTAEEYAALSREQENASLKARNLPTVEESLKERLDNLATAGREARNNRDVDRWMAVAQGFFAMAGGKSQYAMQNMAEGLNIGVKELRAVEQDYRKIDQLQKDKAELLKEATRQEARGDFAKGQTLRKEAEDRRDKIEASNLVVAERLMHYSGDAMGRAIAAKSADDTKKAAAALRAQAAADAAQDRQYRFNIDQQNRTDRFNKAREDKRDKLELDYRKTDVDYKSHVALSNQLSTMGLREDLKPEQQKIYDGLVTKYNNVGTAIDTRARTFADKRIKEDSSLQADADNIIKGKK